MAELSRLVLGRPLAALPDALSGQTGPGTKVLVVADSAVARGYGQDLLSGLKKADFDAHQAIVPAGERSKSLEQAGKLLKSLARANFERSSWLIALGGGVIGDLAGFVAATYLRGVPYVQAPTTLLAQVDASIGGKTGVDIPEGKNLVGSFYHPRIIWIDPSVLRTLPAKHWRNGLAEVIKYGAIADAGLFSVLEQKMDQLLKGYSADWEPIVRRCAELKADIVAKDPTETNGLRAILNFGHSVGHAIEAATGYRRYLHGEAISIGMFVAGMLSERLAGLPSLDRIRLGTLLTKAGLPARVSSKIPRNKFLEFLARDKKTQDESVRFILLKGLGNAVSGQQVPREALEQALSASGL